LSCTNCGSATWQAGADAGWLTVTIVDGQLRVHGDPTGLGAGIFTGTITLTVAGRSDIPAVTLPVSLIIGNLEVLLASLHAGFGAAPDRLIDLAAGS
jgi:hypothetical protein